MLLDEWAGPMKEIVVRMESKLQDVGVARVSLAKVKLRNENCPLDLAGRSSSVTVGGAISAEQFRWRLECRG